MTTPQHPPQALIFDLAGVVLTFERNSMLDAMAALCPDPAAARLEVERILRHPDLRGDRFSLRTLHRLMVDELGAHAELTALRDAWGAGFFPMPGIAEMLAQLAGQTPLLALSNMPRQGWDGIIRRLPELDRFAQVLLSWELRMAKPDPAIFRHAVEVAGVPAKRCFFVDDTERHVAAAQAEGLDAVLFEGVDALRNALRQRGLTI